MACWKTIYGLSDLGTNIYFVFMLAAKFLHALANLYGAFFNKIMFFRLNK